MKTKNRRNPSSADYLTRSSVDGNPEWFRNFATVHSVAMNTDEQSLQYDDLDCSRCTPGGVVQLHHMLVLVLVF